MIQLAEIKQRLTFYGAAYKDLQRILVERQRELKANSQRAESVGLEKPPEQGNVISPEEMPAQERIFDHRHGGMLRSFLEDTNRRTNSKLRESIAHRLLLGTESDLSELTTTDVLAFVIEHHNDFTGQEFLQYGKLIDYSLASHVSFIQEKLSELPDSLIMISDGEINEMSGEEVARAFQEQAKEMFRELNEIFQYKMTIEALGNEKLKNSQ